MAELILELALFLSLGTVVFLVAKSASELNGVAGGSKSFTGFLKNLPVHKYDALLASFAEKNLRKFRVTLLRIDNAVMGYLDRIKSNTNGVSSGSFKDLIENSDKKDNSGTLV